MSGIPRYSHAIIQTPKGLIFEGITDIEGRLYIDFDPKEMHLGADYEIGLTSYTIDTSTMYNILENEYTIRYIDKDGVVKNGKLSNLRIATCLELLRAIEKLHLGLAMDFSNVHVHSVDLKKGKLMLPVKLARCLDIVNSEHKISSLLNALNPKFTFTTEKLTIDGISKDYITITTSGDDKLNLSMIYLRNIWNLVSDQSFQNLYFYSDIVVDEIISGQRLPFLGVFPFKENQLMNRWHGIDPIWRRVDREKISRCYVQLADSRGRTFKNVRMSVHCRIRRRNLT